MNAEQRLGYSITIFVAGEKFSGLRMVDKTNWNGRGLLCSRASFPNLKKREELKKAGVYFLLGPPEDGELPRLYIGEGDPVLPRLENHHSNKAFWTQAVMFVSKDQTLNKAKIQHLESRLVELAQLAKRCALENGNTPDKPSLSEGEEAEAEGFLEELLLCLPSIGVPYFDQPEDPAPKVEVLHVEVKGAKATGFESDDGFVIVKGSFASTDVVTSMMSHTQALRTNLIAQGILVPQGNLLRFTQNYVFNSPSMGASMVAGNSSNGRELWKTTTGKTLKQIQEAEAAEAS
jgi:hypothetical protein